MAHAERNRAIIRIGRHPQLEHGLARRDLEPARNVATGPRLPRPEDAAVHLLDLADDHEVLVEPNAITAQPVMDERVLADESAVAMLDAQQPVLLQRGERAARGDAARGINERALAVLRGD